MVQKLTFHERERLFEYLTKDYKKDLIAQLLKRHISTIYREIKRLSPYSPIAAQNDAIMKSKNSKKKDKLQDFKLKNYVLIKGPFNSEVRQIIKI